MRVLIAGGGIGGLTTALSLHAADRRVVYEAAPAMRELGVGIDLLPHAVAPDCESIRDYVALDEMEEMSRRLPADRRVRQRRGERAARLASAHSNTMRGR